MGTKKIITLVVDVLAGTFFLYCAPLYYGLVSVLCYLAGITFWLSAVVTVVAYLISKKQSEENKG